MGFPGSSADKESVCNIGDPGSIPGLGRSRRRDRLPTPVFLDSLVAQMVKNPPAIQETWVRSLGWEDPLEEGMATHSSILAWRILWAIVHGVTKSWIQLKQPGTYVSSCVCVCVYTYTYLFILFNNLKM